MSTPREAETTPRRRPVRRVRAWREAPPPQAPHAAPTWADVVAEAEARRAREAANRTTGTTTAA